MDALYTVAGLPKPLDAQHGQVRVSVVSSLRGSKKRKRHEVAVGIDGEGVNVYNVQSQTLVNSYAIPPQSYLCCPPCSLYIRRSKANSSERRTYLVLRDGPQDQKRRIVCLAEHTVGMSKVSDTPTAPTKKERKIKDGDVLNVDVVGSSSTDDPIGGAQVLVTYRNGSIDCMSADLSQQYWQHEEDQTDEAEILYVAVTDIETARKGLLAGREDILALLESPNDNANDSIGQQLLLQVLRRGPSRFLRLYTIRRTSRNPVQSMKAGIQFVMDQELTGHAKLKSPRTAVYDLHAPSGSLVELSDGRLTMFDLHGTLPRVAMTIAAKGATSFVRVSASSILVASPAEAVMYETKYGSVQARLPLSSDFDASSPGQKRKREIDAVQEQAWNLVSYFDDLGTCVGLRGSDLKAIQVSENLRRTKRAKTGGTSLIDVLGKDAAAHKDNNNTKAKKFEIWKEQVDSACRENDLDTLEAVVIETLKVRLRAEQHEQIDTEAVQSMDVDDGVEAPVTTELTPDSFDSINIDMRKVQYILGAVFDITRKDGAGSSRLRPSVASENIYIWLALAGFLDVASVRHGLAYHDSHNEQASIMPGDIMASFCASQNSFELMHDLLALPTHWDVADVAQALKALVQSFETPVEGSALKALPARPADTDMADGDAESTFESEEAAAERELAITESILNSGLEIRSTALRLVLRRLQAFPSKAVTAAFRKTLTHEELIFFMKILRVELIDGGWTQRYEESEEAPEVSDAALGSISLLLNCAIDAVGISGWLVGQSSDRLGAAELIQGLKVEVSAGLEGLYAVDMLGTYLDEMGRCAFSGAAGNGETVLPMGGRVQKVGKRHRREEQRARVGRYAIERIRV